MSIIIFAWPLIKNGKESAQIIHNTLPKSKYQFAVLVDKTTLITNKSSLFKSICYSSKLASPFSEADPLGIVSAVWWVNGILPVVASYYLQIIMGNSCRPEQQDLDKLPSPPSTILIVVDKPLPRNGRYLLEKYAPIRSEATSFPMVNTHVQQKIVRFSKFEANSNPIWHLHSPYNLTYSNQYPHDQNQLPKGYTKLYKTKDNGDFAGYYEGKATYEHKPDLTRGFYVFPNASYFVGSGSDQGRYTNEVTDLRYEGQWVNEQPHGKGQQNNNKGTYEGEYWQGQKHGRGKFIWKDGSQYTGNFSKGSIDGKGTYINPSLHYTYEGEYHNDLKHGQGVQSNSNSIYTGIFYNNKRCGAGKLVVYQDERKQRVSYTYEGMFFENKPYGKGTYVGSRPQTKVTGIWDQGTLITISQ